MLFTFVFLSLKDAMLNMFEPENMHKMYDRLNDRIAGASASSERLVEHAESYMSYVYDCLNLAKQGRLEPALEIVQELLRRDRELFEGEVEGIRHSVKAAVSAACILALAQALLGGLMLDSAEVPTFVCNVICDPQPWQTLRRIANTPVTFLRPPVDRLCWATALLLRIDEPGFAIRSLFDFSLGAGEFHERVLLGYLLLNGRLMNCRIAVAAEESLKLLKDVTERVLSHYPRILFARNKEPLRTGILGAIVAASSPAVGLILASVFVPGLAAILADPGTWGEGSAAETEPSEFLRMFLVHFVDCKVEQVVRSDRGFALFDRTLNEIMLILAECERKDLVRFSPASEPIVAPLNMGTPGVEKRLAEACLAVLETLWKCLTVSMVRQTGTHGGFIKQACSLLRAERVKEGVELLTGTDYRKVSVETQLETVKELAATLFVYANKEEQGEVLAAAKENPKLHGYLVAYSNSVPLADEDSHERRFRHDPLFINMVSAVKKTLTAMIGSSTSQA